MPAKKRKSGSKPRRLKASGTKRVRMRSPAVRPDGEFFGGTTDAILRHFLLTGSYDAARTTAENRRHWANADHLSADAANSASVLKVLRKRARYECFNNSFCMGIVNTLANDCIGTGPRLQMHVGGMGQKNAKEVEQFIEKQWAAWCRVTSLVEKLRTARKSRAHSGEAFLLKFTNDNLEFPVKLDVRLYEPDQISNPGLTATTRKEIDGIVLDKYGNPKEYHILKSHPGDTYMGANVSDKVTVNVEDMIHWFEPSRPGQHRGIPEITPALPLFAVLRRYTLAVLESAETAASISAVAHTNYLPNDAAAAIDDYELGLERNTMTFLPEGWDLTQLRPEQPTVGHAEFVRCVLSEIARCLNMPYSIAACDSSNSNMASGLLDQKTYYKSVRIDRARAENVILHNLMVSWLKEAVQAFEYLKLYRNVWNDKWSWSWAWPKLGEHGDPAKVARGRALDLATGATNLAVVHAEEGRDWEDELDRTERIKKRIVEVNAAVAAHRRELMEMNGLDEAAMAPVEKLGAVKGISASESVEELSDALSQ